MDRTKDIDRLQNDVDTAIRNLDPVEALEFVEELASRLEGTIEGLRSDIEALDNNEDDD